MTDEQRERCSASQVGRVAWNKGIPMTDAQRAADSAAQMGNTNFLGHHHSEKAKMKMSAAAMGNKYWVGRHHTEETKAKLSASHKGLPSWNKGRPMSAETRAKDSAAHKGIGHPQSPETRAKISASKMGHIVMPEAAARSGAGHWKGGFRMACTRSRAKRRILGSIPLNSPFDGSEGHHVDKEHVVFIPKELHRSLSHNVFTGKNMAEINVLAEQFLREAVL